MSSSRFTFKSALNILGWAVFLGASWTWCIGMFLPVLLVRDYGFWAWVVFAVPNVVGAAAMGWVLRDAEASRKMVAEHGAACRWFSVVTIAFNAYFLFWMVTSLVNMNASKAPEWPPALELLVLTGLPLVLAILFAPRGQILAAAIALAMSYGCAILFFRHQGLPSMESVTDADSRLLWLWLVCVFGFLLCPYLDLTFHEARQETSPAGGRVAFGLGFGLFFFSMIVFSLGYALLAESMFGVSLIYLFVHLICQLNLKLLLHGRALLGKSRGTILAIAIVTTVVALSGSQKIFHSIGLEYGGLDVSEIIYRCFLAFYGLAFPAYVWLCMVRRRGIGLWGLSVLIATPMYWMGFIERQTWWLGPGVGIVLLAGLLPAGAPKMGSALEVKVTEP